MMTFLRYYTVTAFILSCICVVAIGIHHVDADGPLLDDKSKYMSEVQEWRRSNEEKLSAPFGWLALTGHYWLENGANSLGTANECSIQIPTDLDSKAKGSVTVDGDQIILTSEESSGILVNEKWASACRLNIEPMKEEADGTDSITIGERLKLQLVRRAGRLAIRVRDQESFNRKTFEGKSWVDIQPAFCVEATFKPFEPEKSIRIINIKGDSVEAMLAGTLSFQLNEREFTLDAISEDHESLFIVFKDLTSGKTTYGPGRFLTLKAPVDGQVTIDFNKAYNPPCAFSPHTLCPLPPRQNHLDVEINAGELKVGN